MKCRHCYSEKALPFYASHACVEGDGCIEANYDAFLERSKGQCPAYGMLGGNLVKCDPDGSIWK